MFTTRMISASQVVTYTFGGYATLASSSPDTKPFTFELAYGIAGTNLHKSFIDQDANHTATDFTIDGAAVYQMKIITIPTLSLSRLNGVTGDVTATISIGIGPSNPSFMNSTVNDLWNTPGQSSNGSYWSLATIDQDNTQTNLVSVGSTRIVVGQALGGSLSKQGFKTKCTYRSMTQVSGNFQVEIRRIS
jgi:hypothetical protein